MIVDDQVSVRRALRAVVEATAGFVQVGDAASGLEALRQVDGVRPDLILIDVCMPGMDGIEATRRLTNTHPGCVVVLVSLENLEDAPAVVASCGAVDFVRKQELRPATLRALWRVHGTHG